MEKTITAKEFVDSANMHGVEELMIAFAKMHVKAALKAAAKDGTASVLYGGLPVNDPDNNIWINEDSIINAYPLTNIS